jgi:hypothetical protein
MSLDIEFRGAIVKASEVRTDVLMWFQFKEIPYGGGLNKEED